MKREYAIGVLRDLWCFQKSERYSDIEIREVCEMAIKALKREQAWEEDNAFREKKWGKGGDEK